MGEAKILIIETDLRIAKHLQAVLHVLGYKQIEIVTNVKKAIQSTKNDPPHLILCAIQLKGDIDGIQAIEQIQLHFKGPVIYLSTLKDEPTLQRAMKTRPANYLPQPFKSEELQIAIELALMNYL